MFSRVIRMAAAAILVLACSSEESRLDDAEEIGAIDIDPRASFGGIRKLTPVQPAIEHPAGKYGIENLIKAQWGKRLFSQAILDVHFYAPGDTISDDSRPISVTVRPPFQGSILGVRLGDSVETALTKVRRHFPAASILPPSPYRVARPGDTSEQWTIRLDDKHLLSYHKDHRIRRGKPVQPPVYNISLRYGTTGYSIVPKKTASSGPYG